MTLDQVKRKNTSEQINYSLPLEIHTDKNLEEEEEGKEKNLSHLSIPLVLFFPRQKVDAGWQGLGEERTVSV